jgi:hypothetical protein
MIAQPMFVEGGIRVLDAEDEKTTVGFVFVEPVSGPEGGQLQRWILSRLSTKYLFRKWTRDQGAPASLAEWTSLVTTPAPGGTWGDDVVAKGLWVKDALYMVAQSTPVVPSAAVPMPRFPRSRLVDFYTMLRTVADSSPAATKREGRGRMSRPPVRHDRGAPLDHEPSDRTTRTRRSNQIIDGDYVLTQLAVAQGECFSDLNPRAHRDQSFFESREYFLFKPGYRGAGNPEVPVTSLDPRERSWHNAPEFHEHVLSAYAGGARYEATGCNYYQSKNAPPGKEMGWFL